MDRGALYAEEHDLVLRKVGSTTGKPLSHWFSVLRREGIAGRGFLAGLALLRDRHGVSHHEASAVVYAFLNPYLVPDELREDVGLGRTETSRALAEEEEAEEEVRETVPGKRRAAKPAAKPARARKVARAKPKRRAKPATAKAGKPARKKARRR